MIDLTLPYFRYIKENYSEDTFNKYIECITQENYKCARINTLKKDCSNQIFNSNKKLTIENAYYIDNEINWGNLIYHELGAFYIQEPSAMAPVKALDPSFDAKILDLCAAPGSKSTQIAVNMKNSGLLVCNEINRGRAQILYENIKRLGIQNSVVVSMHPKQLEKYFNEYFDLILVDAPCSGEGMFRKYPDTIQNWTIENVNACALRQYEILNSAIRMLKPGGNIIYSTCTLNKIENEHNIDKLIENKNLIYKDFILNDIYNSKYGMLKLTPLNFEGEGQFIAKIHKINSICSNECKKKSNDKLRKPTKIELEKFTDFCKDNNIKKFYPNYVYNDILMQIPDIDINILSNINVINAGLRLGEIKYNMFVPDFSFARGINNLKEIKNIELNLEQAIKYIEGESVEAKDCNYEGFVLLSYDGYSIAWGKIKNGIIKNHYPKNIRKKLFNHI